jgi:hypothetical protein
MTASHSPPQGREEPQESATWFQQRNSGRDDNALLRTTLKGLSRRAELETGELGEPIGSRLTHPLSLGGEANECSVL